MTRLRHLGRSVLLASKKRGHEWVVAGDGQLVADLSGGPLLQTLVALPMVPESAFSTISGGAGVETPARRRCEDEVQRRAGDRCGGVLWASSGSDAMELAVWAVRKAFQLVDREPSPMCYVVRRGAYHGATYLTRWLSTRRPTREEGPAGCVRLLLDESDAPAVDDSAAVQHAVERLAQLDLAPGAVLLLETVPTTGPRLWPGAVYYGALIRHCHERDVRVVLDEVAAGAHRHGWFSAFDWCGPDVPDAVVVGKSLTCGRHPLGCVLLSTPVAAALREGGGRLPAFTYGLSDAAAWWATACLSSYDALAEQGALAERAEVVAETAGALDGSVTVEHTPTTLRLTLESRDRAERLRRALRQRGLELYEATAVFPAGDRVFFLVCPPLDLPSEVLRRCLEQVVDAARSVRHG